MIYLVFNLLHEYGVSDVAVFNGDFLYSDYIIIANGTSLKHIKNTAFKVSMYFKKNFNQFVIISGVNSDWVVLDVKSVLVHLMSYKSRNFYDLDSLYKNTSKEVFLF